MKLYVGIFVCLVIGGFLLFISLKGIKKTIDQKSWPNTSGIVVGMELNTARIESSDSNARLKGFRWVASILYSYQVNGVAYEGDRMTNSSDTLISTHRDVAKHFDSPPNFIASFINKHQPGTKITVHYKIDDPKISFMNYDPKWMRFIVFIAIAIFFLLTGVFFIFYGARLGLG